MFLEESGPSEVDDPHAVADRAQVGLPSALFLHEPLLFEKDVLWLEVGVGVADAVKEGEGGEELSEEVLDCAEGEALVVVAAEEVVERTAEGLEYQAEMVAVVEGVPVPDDAFLVVRVPSVYRCNYFLLHPC